MFTLLTDIKSCISHTIYGRAGDKVKLIDCSNGVNGVIAIVESDKGNRYCCNIKCLTKEDIVIHRNEIITTV